MLWLAAGADLLWEKSTAGWLVAAGWCWFGVREKYYWLDTPNRMNSFKNFCGVQRFKIISTSFAPASYFLFVERTWSTNKKFPNTHQFFRVRFASPSDLALCIEKMQDKHDRYMKTHLPREHRKLAVQVEDSGSCNTGKKDLKLLLETSNTF